MAAKEKNVKNPQADAKIILDAIRNIHPDASLFHVTPTKPQYGFEIMPIMSDETKARLLAALAGHPIDVQISHTSEGKNRLFLMKNHRTGIAHSERVLEALEKLISEKQ